MATAAEKKKMDILSSPSGTDDLWAIMGMKKFSIMDNPKDDAAAETPDLGKPLLDSGLSVDLTISPVGDGSVVRLELSFA